MRQKPAPRDTFFNLKQEPQQTRPASVATEFVDTDWDGEEDEVISEPEDNSPRVSLQSVSRLFSFHIRILFFESSSSSSMLTSNSCSLGSRVSQPFLRTTRPPPPVQAEARRSIWNIPQSK